MTSVASPRGSNRDVIEHGVTGFFAGTNEEWIVAIERLLGDSKLREEMGRAARERIVARVSADHVLPNTCEEDGVVRFLEDALRKL